MASKPTTEKQAHGQRRPMGRPIKETRATVNRIASFDPVKGIELVAKVTDGPARLEDRPVFLNMSKEVGREIAKAYGDNEQGSLLIYAQGPVGTRQYDVHTDDCKFALVVHKLNEPERVSASSRRDIITHLYNPLVYDYDRNSDEEVGIWGADVKFHTCLSDLE